MNLKKRLDRIENALPARALLPDGVTGLIFRVTPDGPERLFLLEDGRKREVQPHEIETFREALIEAAKAGDMDVKITD